MSIMDEWLKLENEAIEKQNEDDIELSSVEGETEKFVISRTLVLSTGINEEIKLKQGDHNSRVLRLDIQKDATAFLKLNNASVFLVVQKPNGLKEKLQGTVVDALNGSVEFAFSREVLSTAGVAKCEVVRVLTNAADERVYCTFQCIGDCYDVGKLRRIAYACQNFTKSSKGDSGKRRKLFVCYLFFVFDLFYSVDVIHNALLQFSIIFSVSALYHIFIDL